MSRTGCRAQFISLTIDKYQDLLQDAKILEFSKMFQLCGFMIMKQSKDSVVGFYIIYCVMLFASSEVKCQTLGSNVFR